GPVCRSYTDAKDALIKLINSNFLQPEKYNKRARDFFQYIDTDNCRRVYQAILEMDDRHEHIQNTVIKHHPQKTRQTIKAFWWRYRYPVELNFGDEITAYIVESLFAVKI